MSTDLFSPFLEEMFHELFNLNPSKTDIRCNGTKSIENIEDDVQK